eukprot:5051967-Ditylum_brightwellii.AAC.1
MDDMSKQLFWIQVQMWQNSGQHLDTPTAMVLDDESLASTEGSTMQADRVDDIHQAIRASHHVRNDQNATSVILKQGSSNENTTLPSITISRNTPHTASEQNLYIFTRNHPSPVQ